MTNNAEKSTNLIQTLQYISLFIVLIGLFLGSMYAFDGNLFIAFPLSFGLVALLYYFLDLMIAVRLQTKRSGTSMGIKMLWGLYAISVIPVSLLVLHMINIEFLEREEIQKEGMQKIYGLQEIKNSYNNTLEGWVKTKRNNLINDLLLYKQGLLTDGDIHLRNKVSVDFVNSIDRSSVESITFGVDSGFVKFERLKFERHLEQVFGENTDFINDHAKVIEGWSRFKIGKSLNDLDASIPRIANELNDFLKAKTAGKTLSYNKSKLTKPSLINQPLKLFMKHLSVLSILVVTLVNGLILLPYFIAPKKTYRSGSKSNPVSRNSNTGGVTKR
jgi:hypothetical protein